MKKHSLRLLATDHKIIAIQFLLSGLCFFLLGGLLAMLMRWQLSWPSDPSHPVPIIGHLLWPAGVMPPESYNVILTMHSTIMVFFVVIPLLVGVFGNYLIPLKIGAADMAFPFLNGLSFWVFLAAGMVLLAGVFLPGGGPSAGWTSYPPLSAILFNGAGNSAGAHFVLPLLQAPTGTWPVIPVIVNFGVLLLLFGYIAVHHAPGFVVPVAVVAACIAVRCEQTIALDGQACWFLSLFILGISSVLGAINHLTTTLTMRCPGMSMFRLPLSIWSLFITAFITLLATPVLNSVLFMNLLDHHRLTSFFEPPGGYALLHPHLFWFYAHPAVYIMILPAMGIVSDILPVFARKPIFGYRAIVYSMAIIAILGFVVWGHHMYQSNMNPALGSAFAFSSMLIAVPSGIEVLSWVGTLWGGSIRFTVPMLNAVAFVSLFVIGGMSGIFLASPAVDLQLHMTYFVVAHIHYVLFGGSIFGIFAGIYFWYPKMFGRLMNPTLGYIHFFLSFIAFNCTFFAMHILGLQGLPRRMPDYRNYTMWAHLQPMQQFISMSAFTLLIAQIPFIINFLGSWIWGAKAPDNPWQATTLEWTDAASPPLPGNFAEMPVVYRGPYEYSNPLVAEDWLAQSRRIEHEPAQQTT
jgi:cytochrome c oxidase subunit 1